MTTTTPTDPSMIVIDNDVMVATRDGVRLATDIYRPADGQSPVLLVRTPYGKHRLFEPVVCQLDILRAVRAAYAVVAQDVRGRIDSEGVFEPNVNEACDGVDAIALGRRPAVVVGHGRHLRRLVHGSDP